MKGKKSRLLVVDASIMRGAGQTEHPVSKACRNFLEAILTICHRVVLTPEIREEWNRHQSKFARKWRVQMNARKKVWRIDTPRRIDLRTTGASPNKQASIEKDRCLLEAAMSTERVIVTNDNALTHALAETTKGSKILRNIKWINPTIDGVSWLENPGKL